MLVAFPVLVSYAFFCVDKEKRNSFIAYLCLAFFVAVLIALPLLVAALMAYLRSGRGEVCSTSSGMDLRRKTESVSLTLKDISVAAERLYIANSAIFSAIQSLSF